MSTCEHHFDRKVYFLLFYCYLLLNSYFQEEKVGEFFIIKRRYPGGIEKSQIWVEKKANGALNLAANFMLERKRPHK